MPSPEAKARSWRARRRLIGLCVAVVAVLAVACEPVKPPPEEPPPPPPPGWIATSPAIFPAFTTDIPDYVARCDASAPVQVSVDAPAETTVSVNGLPFQGGQFATEVTRDVGQSFWIVVQAPSGTTTHEVRCLPADFPDWTASRTGQTQAEYYATTTPWSVPAFQSRPVVFDNNGVPVWWSDTTSTYFTTVLQDPNDNNNPKVTWTFQNGAGAQEHNLDGSVYHTVNTTPNGSDPHDILALPNGNYVMVENVSVPAQNLTACGGTASQTLIDQVIQEITPQGAVVSMWDTKTHIPVSETDPQWYSNNCSQGDAYHWNSIEPTSDGYILSFRHLDAIYKINKTTGAVEWKLGGSSHVEALDEKRLAVQQDPVFDGADPATNHFGGQHDARLLGDGTVALHDNGTNLNRPPRAVRYQIDTTNKTATLLESHDDALMPASNCCGSARKLPGGNWVMGWGGTQGSARVGTEITDSGSRVFLLQFSTSGGMYRFTPVPFGVLSRNALRAGMDTQYGTPPVGTTSSGASRGTAKAPAPSPPASTPQQIDQP